MVVTAEATLGPSGTGSTGTIATTATTATTVTITALTTTVITIKIAMKAAQSAVLEGLEQGEWEATMLGDTGPMTSECRAFGSGGG